MPTTDTGARSALERAIGSAHAPPPLERLLRISSVMEVTSLSKASIYRKLAEGTFPAPLKIGKSRVAWRQSAIAAWMAEQSETQHV
jgi:prophage regulatory protein